MIEWQELDWLGGRHPNPMTWSRERATRSLLLTSARFHAVWFVSTFVCSLRCASLSCSVSQCVSGHEGRALRMGSHASGTRGKSFGIASLIATRIWRAAAVAPFCLAGIDPYVTAVIADATHIETEAVIAPEIGRPFPRLDQIPVNRSLERSVFCECPASRANRALAAWKTA